MSDTGRIPNMRSLIWQTSILGMAALVCWLAGCGPSADDVIEEYQGEYRSLKAKLRTLAESLPQGRLTRDQPPLAPLVPPLVLSTDAADGNAEAIMVDHLTSDDPRPEFDLLLSPDLTAALDWTREGRKDNRGDPTQLDATLRSCLELDYLVVHRIAELKLPEAVNDREYRPGSVTVEGFVFRLASGELLASYVITATADDKVEATVLPDEKDAEALVRFARSTLWKNCRKAIAQKLQTVVGGTATID
jgi:hypothetical protein